MENYLVYDLKVITFRKVYKGVKILINMTNIETNYEMAKRLIKVQKNLLESGDKLIKKQYEIINNMNNQKNNLDLNKLENLQNSHYKKQGKDFKEF